MAVTISHRNQNTADPHASGHPSPVIGGMVRIDGQRWLVKYQEGLFPLCKKLFGFIANLRQAHYKSNAKTTSQRANSRETPHSDIRRRTRFPRPFALSLSKGPPPTNSPRITPATSRRPRLRENLTLCAGQPTDTALLPPLQRLGYRLPMAVTISHRNQNTTGPHAFGGPSPVVGGMVRIDGQRWLVKYQEGLFIPLQKTSWIYS